MRECDQQGFVLRRQDYGDTSLLVDIFTRGQGRFRVVAKGAKSGKASRARVLQPFSSLQLGWSGRSELKTLTQSEPVSTYRLDKQATICGFYVNELLWNFLQVQDPHEELYDVYEHCLVMLAEGEDLELALRNFEFFLLKDTGYETILDMDAETGDALNPEHTYRFELENGLVKTSERENAYPGRLFLAIANNDLTEAPARQLAKKITRQVIHHRMDGKELHSRKWFMTGR